MIVENGPPSSAQTSQVLSLACQFLIAVGFSNFVISPWGRTEGQMLTGLHRCMSQQSLGAATLGVKKMLASDSCFLWSLSAIVLYLPGAVLNTDTPSPGTGEKFHRRLWSWDFSLGIGI